MKYNEHKTELLIGLWNHCNNRCRFCYNQQFFHLPKNLKQHLQICKDILQSSFVEEFNYLRFLGGELFDGAIDQLNVKKDFDQIIDLSINLLKEKKIEKINFLTNLIYKNNNDLKETLLRFEKENLISKIEISTSYDVAGRFSEESEQWWWNNIKWLNKTYPDVKIDIGVIMTQPFITSVTKEWLDTFIGKINNVNVYFIELDTAILKCNKQNSPFKDLFPIRQEFLRFLKKLKDWNYYDLLMKKDGTDPWSNVYCVQFIHVEEFDFPIFKNQCYLLDERKTFLEDGYIDSDIPLFEDVRKMLTIGEI